MPDIGLWQALLAAEMPVWKLRSLIQGAGASSLSPESLLSDRRLSEPERERIRGSSQKALEAAVASGVRLIEERDYPNPLRQWEYHPPALFTWGNWSAVHGVCVGIVGTRAASTYGKAVAYKFAEALARAGATIVSGGALGIDGAAHKGALAAEGRTVAVLATGVDRVYPAVHRGLFQQIRQEGCLVSGYACGVAPSPYKFLVRNQLVAALCQALIVVEAPERSGSISTAHAANDLSRHVLVVPANIDQTGFRGSHALIRDGATLVDHPDQVLDLLGLLALKAPTPAPTLSAAQEQILKVLDSNPLSAELIVSRTGLDSHEVLSELTMLELEGVVIREPGGYAALKST